MMLKTFSRLCLLCFLMTFSHIANAKDQKLFNEIAGSYTIVGKQGTTDKTYTGTLDVTLDGSNINIVRTIDAKQTKGTATIKDTESGRMLMVEYEAGDDVMIGQYYIFLHTQHNGMMPGYLLLNPPQHGDKWLESIFNKKENVDCEG